MRPLFNHAELGKFALVVITILKKIETKSIVKKDMTKEKKYVCPRCKKIVPQVTRNLGDKEYLCVPCYNKKNVS